MGNVLFVGEVVRVLLLVLRMSQFVGKVGVNQGIEEFDLQLFRS